MDILQKFYDIFDQEREDALIQHTSDTAIKRLTYNHVLYLDAVWRLNSPTLSALANHLNYSKASVTNMVNRLTKDGLLEKLPSKIDQRSSRVSITERGENILLSDYKAFEKIAKKMHASLTTDEQKTLEALIEKALTSL